VVGRDDSMTTRTDRLLVPDSLARAAAMHQRYRLQLDALRRQQVSAVMCGERGPSLRRGAAAIVLIHESRVARDALHDEVSHFATYLEGTGAPLRRVIDHVRGMLEALHASGVLCDDGGAMADEIAHWIIEDSKTRRITGPQPRMPERRAKVEARVLPMRPVRR
jgi:hypothetical protein